MEERKHLIVIHERDHDDGDRSVIGVSDTVEKAERMIDKYYGEPMKLLSEKLILESIEWIRKYELTDVSGLVEKKYHCTVWLEHVTLNEV